MHIRCRRTKKKQLCKLIVFSSPRKEKTIKSNKAQTGELALNSGLIALIRTGSLFFFVCVFLQKKSVLIISMVNTFK